MLQDIVKAINLQELWSDFHIIAMEYNWERETIRQLSRNERQRWAELIQKDLKNRWDTDS